jgi:hypothetical protein
MSKSITKTNRIIINHERNHFNYPTIKTTSSVTEHSLNRHRERCEKSRNVMTKILKIIEKSVRAEEKNQLTNLNNYIYIYNNWKNKKQHYEHEGKCIILFEDNYNIYKLSCCIRLVTAMNGKLLDMTFTYTTFMNVCKTDTVQIKELQNKKKNAKLQNMFISNKSTKKENTIYLIEDK